MTTSTRFSARASARPIIAIIALAALVVSLLSIASPVLGVAPGNNGTVKIHEGATEEEPIVANDPQVCTFHLHFFFADPAQAGDWWIEEWAPGDEKGTVVLAGAYDTANDGEDRQPEEGVYELPDGHYKLFWEGAATPSGNVEIKHKVFWVDCEAAPSGSMSASTSASQSSSASASQSVSASASQSSSVEGSVSASVSASTSVGGSTLPEQSVAGNTGTPEQNVQGGTGFPAASMGNGSVANQGTSNAIPAIAFGIIALLSLGSLAAFNVVTVRRR